MMLSYDDNEEDKKEINIAMGLGEDVEKKPT